MSLRVFDPDSADEETRRLSRLAQSCWSPLAIVYDPLKAGSIDSTDTVPHDKAIVRAQNADFVPNKRIKGRPECTVFVGNLSATTSERSLREEFNRYGRIVKATVVEDIITGRSRGYGFVEYSLEGEAVKAYESAHRTWLDGNKLIVDMECGRLLPGWVPRRLGGGFNGRKESGQLRFGCRERPFRKPIKLLTEQEIKEVFEKTMGRKLSSQAKDNIDPPTDGGGTSRIPDSVNVIKDSKNTDKERQSSDRHKRNREREGDKEHKDRGRRSSDWENRKRERGSDEQSRGRESKKRTGDSDTRKHHKKKRNRSRSDSEEERERKHHKRKKERSTDKSLL